MAENKKYGRVWIPSEDFWDLAIPMPDGATVCFSAHFPRRAAHDAAF